MNTTDFREPTSADLDLLEAAAAGTVWNDCSGRWFIGYNSEPQPSDLAREIYDHSQWINGTPVGPDDSIQPMCLTFTGEGVLERHRPGRLAEIERQWEALACGATDPEPAA